jgi:hypothetical protein
MYVTVSLNKKTVFVRFVDEENVARDVKSLRKCDHIYKGSKVKT